MDLYETLGVAKDAAKDALDMLKDASFDFDKTPQQDVFRNDYATLQAEMLRSQAQYPGSFFR